MPYNTNPIPKKKLDACDGTSVLPPRVRKIIKVDDEIDACTPAAAFLITIASEMFIQDLADSAHRMTKIEKKPRKNIQYKDLANAVARIDKLEFLSDVIPRTIPFSKVLEKKKKADGGAKDADSLDAEGLLTNGAGQSSGKPIQSHALQENGSGGNSPIANETNRMKDLHLSNQSNSSRPKKGRGSLKDQDGDLLMH